jgi:hypothetical protein
MSQCAGTALTTGLQPRVWAARSCRWQLERAVLTQAFLKELPAPSTHADTEVARVAINSPEIILLRVKLQLGYHEELWTPTRIEWATSGVI